MPDYELGKEQKQLFNAFTRQLEAIEDKLSPLAPERDLSDLQQLRKAFDTKTDNFFQENRLLNIGVVGQVKAGKSSFLNTLLFNGQEILPKASTPKTATLTKMEYADENAIEVEFYSDEEWEEITDDAKANIEGEPYASHRELVEMADKLGLDVEKYTSMGKETIHFDTYEDLVSQLNDYVGENGRYTPVVKSVVLKLHNEAFRGISIVDTPGLNDTVHSRTQRTREFIEVCDVVFFLSQSSSFLDTSDWTLLSAQLPQKGVKKLVLVASKYDSGVRDVLRPVPQEEDIWGDGDEDPHTVADACAVVEKKLHERAKNMVKKYTSEANSSQRLNQRFEEIVNNCENILLVSAMAENMAKKPPEEYTPEEKNIYEWLHQYSDDVVGDLRYLGNFDKVRAEFRTVIENKAQTLAQKSSAFIPDATAELQAKLDEWEEKTEVRIKTLEKNDRSRLLQEKDKVTEQIDQVSAKVDELFSRLADKVTSEGRRGAQELRKSSKNYFVLQERQGTETKEGCYTTGILFWKKRHYYEYQDTYTYWDASDAVENLWDFATESADTVEKVFSKAVDIQTVRRDLLNIVLKNFDTAREDYDSHFFRITVTQTLNDFSFPVIKISINDKIAPITAKFSGQIRNSGECRELKAALADGVQKILTDLSDELEKQIRDYKENLSSMEKGLLNKLLENVNREYRELLQELDKKDIEIKRLTEYAGLLGQVRSEVI